MSEPGAALLLALACALAFFVEAALGFGATLLALGLGALLCPLERLLPSVVCLDLFLSGWLLLRDRRAVAWGLLGRRLVPLMGLGLPLGLLSLRWLGGQRALAAFGAFVVVLAGLELARGRRAEARSLPRALEAALLVLGGVVHGLFATGGPLAVYVAGRSLADKSAFRGTLAALWLVLNLGLLVGYAASGALDRETGSLVALLAGPLVLGTALGEWAHGRLDPSRFRQAVFGLLLLAGLRLVTAVGAG